MAEDFSGRAGIVTGAASGIGRAAALKFAEGGAKVVVADLDTEGSDNTKALIEQRGGEAICVTTDVSQGGEVEALVKQTVATYGRLDFAYNNAGIAGDIVPLVDYSEELWDRVIGINLKGVWLCMKYQIPEMLKQGGGAIVNTASVMGLISSASNPIAYTASKHGVVGLTKSAALTYAEAGIRVNAVCPGYIETPLVTGILERHPERKAQILADHPVGRLGVPEEVAAAAVWLCSDSASFVTGTAMAVDGGYIAH
ncbi:MAG: SDR family oxidoreductase [Rhodospirillaceae bacterium]|mgnify:FL=1|jgi:NAD(P)-dependent dehydrogenase (short-subunit alcohol dehydrogenase family)|nr:SDR family oxidoreductase [Rhodospirillaceae bacterium]MBT5894745.1 SDR family oxidoreductase [Rhodospirillaceae bacterium]MBT6426816.1 SDR family oxidoreductase [Rhodospirillaceae bacterium]MBT7761030.1 SDR family oxidoreductase [Rhodospirillaceae bacterium]